MFQQKKLFIVYCLCFCQVTVSSRREFSEERLNAKPTKSSAQLRETEETTIRQDFGGGGGKIIPTRWPITTPKSKKSSSTRPSTTTAATTTTTQMSGPDNYDPSVIGIFVCQPLQPTPGVVYSCKHSDPEMIDDCTNGGKIGTKATLSCEKFYKTAYGQESTQIECQSNHRWSTHRMFGCNLECGVSARPRNSYIVNGVISNRISWPWHATIFRKKGNDFHYICGGTLISRTLLLTAAHCLTNPTTTTIAKFDEFRIILATKSVNYTENLLDKTSGMYLFYMQNASIPHSYNGLTFESDIAIVQLDRSVELSDYVRPVCFPFQSKENSDIEQLHLSPGSLGQTVGFGIDESGKLSHVLKETALPIVSHRDCGESLERFPTHSQFCAGYRNGTSVCNGDSGGGIYFSEGTGIFNRFMIQGIVSFGSSNRAESFQHGNNCSDKTLAVFTKIGAFASWVQQYMDKWEPDA